MYAIYAVALYNGDKLCSLWSTNRDRRKKWYEINNLGSVFYGIRAEAEENVDDMKLTTYAVSMW